MDMVGEREHVGVGEQTMYNCLQYTLKFSHKCSLNKHIMKINTWFEMKTASDIWRERSIWLFEKYIYHFTKSFINAGITREAMMPNTPFPTCGFCKIFLLLLIEVEWLANLLISAFIGLNFLRTVDNCLLSKSSELLRMLWQHSLIAWIQSSGQNFIYSNLSFPLCFIFKRLTLSLNDLESIMVKLGSQFNSF